MTNEMVFCRGCGKEIHITAPMCPMCGAPQGIAPTAFHGVQVVAAIPVASVDYASRQDISESWKRKFQLIDKAGGPGMPNIRSLTFGERMSVSFNVLAFLFGPFYFLMKGLWRQAIGYTVIALALYYTGLVGYVGMGLAALQAVRANVGYYRKVVSGDAPWV